jgi:hypothetical protein
VSTRAFVGAAIALSAALVLVYLAAGGGSYEPTPVADPCQPREWRDPEGIEESAQQFALSALDGAACELDVSREELAVALATPESRAEFAAEHGIGDPELETAFRAGVVRAIDDAEDAGAVSPLVADALRAVGSRLPVDEAVAVIENGGEFLGGVGGVLDDLSREPHILGPGEPKCAAQRWSCSAATAAAVPASGAITSATESPAVRVAAKPPSTRHTPRLTLSPSSPSST